MAELVVKSEDMLKIARIMEPIAYLSNGAPNPKQTHLRMVAERHAQAIIDAGLGEWRV